MSTKSPSKFWKKLGLGKKGSSTQANRPPSIQSHGTNSTALATNEDDRSVKSKRLSGVFPQRKQSTHSIKRLHQMTAAQPETTPHVPALPSGSNTTTTTAATTATAMSGGIESKQPTDDKPPVEQTHVEPSTQPPKDPELGIDPTFELITHDDIQTDDPPCLELNNNSCNTPPSTKNNKTRSVKSTKSTSSLKKSSNPSLSKSRLRQPSRTNSTTGSTYSATPSASSSASSLPQQKETPSRPTTATPPMPSLTPASLQATSPDQKDQLIQQLQEALQTEQSINRVLQGQKEAITRDLDYFSLTVDELMEEKESLVQKYEEEKLKSQTKEEDLNVLLEKLKSSTDNARDRSMEVDQWKAEIETIKEEMAMEQNELKSVLKRKDQEITRLKNELASAKEEAHTLSSQLDMLLQETAQSTNDTSNHHPSTGAIETPNPSPRLDAQHTMDEVDKRGNKKHAHLSVFTAPPPSCHALDDELMSLTKEKERLQSDYGKIPLSGGGPTSRRRKEQLEEMLDEVDSQLSKVKQKIRRS